MMGRRSVCFLSQFTVYSLSQFEAAEQPHDPLWNTAQRRSRGRSKLSNFGRRQHIRKFAPFPDSVGGQSDNKVLPITKTGEVYIYSQNSRREFSFELSHKLCGQEQVGLKFARVVLGVRVAHQNNGEHRDV